MGGLNAERARFPLREEPPMSVLSRASSNRPEVSLISPIPPSHTPPFSFLSPPPPWLPPPSVPPCSPALGHKGSTVRGRGPKGRRARWRRGQVSFNKLGLFPQLLSGKQASCHPGAEPAKCLIPAEPGPQPQTAVYGVSKRRPSAAPQAINTSFCSGDASP